MFVLLQVVATIIEYIEKDAIERRNCPYQNHFRHNIMRKATAIHWDDVYHSHNGVTTSASNLTFDFTDPNEGFYMMDEDLRLGRGDTSIIMTDIDGSLTGTAGAMAVKEDVYYTRGEDCEKREGWNMDVCEPGIRLARVSYSACHNE